MPRITRPLLAVLAVLGLALAAGCGADDGDAASGAATATTAAVGTPGPLPEVTSPTTLRLAYFANVTHAPALIGVRDGSFAAGLGTNVKLETKVFNAGPAVIEALFAGEVDVAYIGPSPAINGYVRSKGEALRIIAGSTSGGASLVVRPESNISSAKDFAKKKVATPQLGNTQDVALRAWLGENGLKAKEQGGNVTVIPTENATTLTLFQKGDIDAAWVPEPWATRLELQAGGKEFLDEASLWPEGRFVTTHVIVRTEYLQKNAVAVERFLATHYQAVEAINADPAKAKAAANEAIKALTNAALAPEIIDGAWAKLEFTYDPIASSLRESADDAFELGFLGAKKPDLAGIYDLRLLNQVLARANAAPVKD